MDQKKIARCEPGRKNTNNPKGRPEGEATQAPRPPRPDALKAAIDPAEFYARELEGAPPLRAKRDGWTQNFPCCFHEDRTGSFRRQPQDRRLSLLRVRRQGGSVIDFVMLRDGLTLDQARAALAEPLRHPTRRDPRQPAPERPASPAPRRPCQPLHPWPPSRPRPWRAGPRPTRRHGAPSATWTYADPDGRPLAYVLRFDPAEGRKQFAPLTWTEAGRLAVEGPAGAPRPLYGLDRLAARPEAPALICEGEKAADAAALLLPDCVPVATMNGAQAPGKSDFGPLAGRRVLIWPDQTRPARTMRRRWRSWPGRRVRLRLRSWTWRALARDPKTGEPRELPKGWDAADALADGWTPRPWRRPCVGSRFPRQARRRQPPRPSPPPAATALPYPFELKPGGIYYRKPPDAKGGGDDNPPLLVCPPAARGGRDPGPDAAASSGGWCEFRDLDGEPRREVIGGPRTPRFGRHPAGSPGGPGVSRSGPTPRPGGCSLSLLRRWVPEARARSVTQTGWTEDGGAFVLPDRVLGEGPEPVILAAEGERPGVRHPRAPWTIGAKPSAGCVSAIRRLLFCVSLAFAPPLLRLTGTESGGFHLKGASTDASSSGKTTAQRVAASVCGPPDYLQRWRTTDNALEGIGGAA